MCILIPQDGPWKEEHIDKQGNRWVLGATLIGNRLFDCMMSNLGAIPKGRYGPQPDGSFVLPPRAAKEFKESLKWLGWAEHKGSISSGWSVVHIRRCSDILAEYGFEHEEYT